VAIYHLSAKTVSRSEGRSATAAAAYRAGAKIVDERTGEVHDYTKKGGVLHADLILPSGETADRSAFWNRIEKHHKRGDAVLAREVEVSLPAELTKEQRQTLAVGFARELAGRYNVAADVALHAPRTLTSRDLKNNPDQYQETDPETGRKHNGNWHAHILLSACHVSADGTLGKKAVELDPIHCQRAKIENMADRERVRWGELANAALERAGHDSRIDHRRLEVQGIDREPTQHLGHAAAGYERRTGKVSRKREDFTVNALERLAKAKLAGELERQEKEIDKSIIDLSSDLKRAKAERTDQQEATRALAAQAMEKFKAKHEQERKAKAESLAQSLDSYKPAFDEIKKKIIAEGVNPEQRPLILDEIKKLLVKRIESGEAPRLYKAKETEAAAQPTKQTQPASNPEPPKDKLAEQTLSRLIEEERLAWRKNEETKLLDEAENSRQAAWKIKAKEPKKPLLGLYATDKWKTDVAFWERNLQDEIDKHNECKKQAQDAIAGKSEKEHWQRVAFHEKAEQRLKTEHPELAKALLEQRQAEQQKAALATAKATADNAADKAVADFKALAAKREGKSFGYGDSGKPWGALPDELKAAIESFNKQPTPARGVELERMRENFKREPDAAEKLTQQMEQGKVRGFVR